MIQRENFCQVRKLSKSVLHMRHVVTGINQWTFGVARYNAFNAIRAVIGDTLTLVKLMWKPKRSWNTIGIYTLGKSSEDAPKR